jgi:biotin operon repressor
MYNVNDFDKAFKILKEAAVDQSLVNWEDTPSLIMEQGFVSQTDLYKNLRLSRQGLYHLLKKAEKQGLKIQRSVVGKKLYLHLEDVMAALFPKNSDERNGGKDENR